MKTYSKKLECSCRLFQYLPKDFFLIRNYCIYRLRPNLLDFLQVKLWHAQHSQSTNRVHRRHPCLSHASADAQPEEYGKDIRSIRKIFHRTNKAHKRRFILLSWQMVLTKINRMHQAVAFCLLMTDTLKEHQPFQTKTGKLVNSGSGFAV